MASKKGQKRDFKGMSYGEVQRANSKNRSTLPQEHQNWLRANGYKNVGWDQVIALYQKVEELLAQSRIEEMDLEELFLEADRIGNKYQTPEERREFEQQFSKEVSEIGNLIDRQFPDTEIEIIDFSQKAIKQPQKKRHQKKY
jgi:hypothetical protein